MEVLDLCCGAGGASAGIVQAGCTVVGVDLVNQVHYPYRFIQADALTLDRDFLRGFDWIWASFPCQQYSARTRYWRKIGRTYPDLLAAGRAMLLDAGVPFVLENVTGAPLRADLLLCGKMFGLQTYRHRVFEIHGFDVDQPYHPPHRARLKRFRGDAGTYYKVTGHDVGMAAEWAGAMGIEHAMTKKELAESIPPAYSRYIAEYATGQRVARPLLALAE
jgi:SAM-dependent methyltransferase